MKIGRAAVMAVAATMAASALWAPTGSGRAQAAEVTSTARVDIASSAAAWVPSSNARVKAVRAGSTSVLQVRPKRSAGRKTISVQSPLSADTISDAGTTVRASVRLSTSQPGRRLVLRVLEVNGGKVVTSRMASVKPSSRASRVVAVTLRTTRPGSRIQLSTQGNRIRGKNLFRLSAVDVTQQVKAAPGSIPTDSRSCEDIDYSDPTQGVRTFTDDFNGAALDSSRWRVRDNTFLNQDQAWITKDAVTVHDGYLDIAGKRLPQDQWRTNTKALYGTENAIRDYSTGYVDTIDRFGQRYGHFEVRAWVPSAATMSRGIWPAFWLRADHQPGEIDPMESYGAPTIRSFDPSSSYEWNSWADTAQGSTSDANKQKTQGRANVGSDKIWQGWHTYGVNWSPRCLRYTYDGKTVGTVDFEDARTMSYFRGTTFADTFHIRLNMQIGSKYWGWADPAHTRSDFNFKIDWVRVYQGTDLLGRGLAG